MEKAASAVETNIPNTLTKQTDTSPLLVTWSSPSDPTNPYNWPLPRKWATVLLTSLGGLVTLMSGPMLAPALDAISTELSISSAEATMALSIYVLAFAFGPMVLAPCSEVWGRKVVWVAGGSWYVLWNAVCGMSRGRGLLIAARLMAGLGASAEFAVSGAIVADCFDSDERGKSIAVRSFLPLLGPAIGPLIGGVMVQQVSWRWLFYTLSIFAALLVVLFALFLPETHAQTLLSRKAATLRKDTGKPFYAEKDISGMTIAARLKITTLRPTVMLCTQPVIQLAACLMGYQFGLLYIIHSTFASMWIDQYGQSHTASGLHYFAIVTGCLTALLIQWWAMDAIWARLKASNGGVARPENRVPLMIPGTLLLPIGLLMYGWAAEKRAHWAVVDVGVGVLGCGYILSTTAVQSYIVEAYLDYTASGAAASQLPRNVFAFCFPVFAPSLYNSLGYGLGNTTLAAIATVLGVPVPYILWRFGECLRRRGKTIE
ncbi:major facilitator superfamily transporter [Paraphaeosphaeria sporulosa]